MMPGFSVLSEALRPFTARLRPPGAAHGREHGR